jgi:hypothetical protein
MRWHRHNTTTLSPYEIVFGRKPVLPSYLQFEPLERDNPSNRSLNEKKIDAIVKQSMETVVHINKEYYDSHNTSKIDQIFEGDYVMMSTIRSKNALDSKMSGPYIVKNWTSPTTILLESVDGSKLRFHTVVHANRLRKTTRWREDVFKHHDDDDDNVSRYITSSPVVIPGPPVVIGDPPLDYPPV